MECCLLPSKDCLLLSNDLLRNENRVSAVWPSRSVDKGGSSLSKTQHGKDPWWKLPSFAFMNRSVCSQIENAWHRDSEIDWTVRQWRGGCFSVALRESVHGLWSLVPELELRYQWSYKLLGPGCLFLSKGIWSKLSSMITLFLNMISWVFETAIFKNRREWLTWTCWVVLWIGYARRKQIEIPMITFVYIQELASAILCYHGWRDRVVVASSRFHRKAYSRLEKGYLELTFNGVIFAQLPPSSRFWIMGYIQSTVNSSLIISIHDYELVSF